jgi:hypothetical protein
MVKVAARPGASSLKRRPPSAVVIGAPSTATTTSPSRSTPAVGPPGRMRPSVSSVPKRTVRTPFSSFT